MGSVWPVSDREVKRVMILPAHVVVRLLFILECRYPVPTLVGGDMVN